MNVSLLACGLLLTGLIMIAATRRVWLLALWITAYLVFPTANTKVGTAPIYLYDLVTLVLAGAFLAYGDLIRWPRGVPRWHWWFIGSAFVLSLVFGIVRYGFLPELFWIWGHTSLSWLPFAFGVVALTSRFRAEYRAGLQWGILASFSLLAVVAVIQYADLPGADQIANIFYGGLGSVESVETLRVGVETNRATGPHFAPTGFSGMALLATIIFWQVSDDGQRWRRRAVLALGVVIILCTVSRHTMLAAVLGGVVIVWMSEAKRKMKLLTTAAVAVALLSSSAAGLLIKKSWGDRMAKMDSGVLEDDNIAARVLWGPTRLVESIASDPTILITGAGLDPEKLALKTRAEVNFESGFVSNGFLLALYYMGAGGFVMFLWFWWWAFQTARSFPIHLRSILCGCVVMAVIIVAADNYSFMYEPSECLLWLIVGLIGGQRAVLLEQRLTQDAEDLAPDGLEAASYAR